ncbi:hypothetical protein BT93_G1524 [Corymbia citriodora subsp. variegata]|nr:hypothetical protein BT93_G1524 [Corymbia citriodora subsp. variegata]
MASGSKWPYPPCCSLWECCIGREGRSWPELVGQNGEKAKAVIEKDDVNVKAILVPVKGGIRKMDYCCNRAYVWIDENGNVAKPPVVG